MIPTPEKRIADFERLGFGMFVHWGLYSQLGRGEWVQHAEKIPREEYVKLRDTFTASRFDPRRWAQTAKAAGARYITLTTRHHEGFSLFDTKGLNTFDAPHSPVGRDLIREYVDACREFDIVPFFYHTTLDWYNPDFNDNFPRYLQYLRDSVELLCTEYGKIGGLWFDGNWSKKGADWEEDALYAVIRKHQPDAIIVNNTGVSNLGELGNIELDSVTFEQGRPEPMNREGMKKYVAAEMCHTMNAHWAYGADDVNYKSLSHLIETFCACRKVGANYLLNIGPTGEGEIPLMEEAIMRGIGDWINRVGSCVYDGKPCGVIGEGKNFALRNGKKMWFFVHELGTYGTAAMTANGGGIGGKVFSGLNEKVRSVHWTDNGEELEFTQKDDKIGINATGYRYGTSLVVRVAEAELE